MKKISTFLTLFALMLFASDAFAQRGGGGRGGGGPRGGGGGGGGMQMGQGGGGQCQRGGGGGAGGGMSMQMMMRGGGTTTQADTVDMVTQMMLSMDRNRDGMIASNEVPPPMLNRLSGADANGDGMLNRLEQMAVIDRVKILSGRTNATGIGLNADIFNQLDRNQDSTISRNEVPRSLQRLFRTLDSNNDGSLDSEEQTAVLAKVKEKLNPGSQRKKEPAL